LIPLGAIEQHGPHLPLSTDIIIPQEICKLVSEKIESLISPPIFLSFVERKHWKPGTLSIDLEMAKKLLKRIMEEFIECGFNRIFIVNGHEENKILISEVCYELIKKYGIKIISCEWWKIAWKEISKILDSSKEELGPGCEDETSILLYLYPELVKKEKIEDFLTKEEIYVKYPVKNPSELGTVGKPSSANMEKGKKILELIVKKIIETICLEFEKESKLR